MIKFKKILFLFVVLIDISSCSTQIKSLKKNLNAGTSKYSYVDRNGNFLVNRTTGFMKENERYFVKRQMEIIGKNKDNIIEQSVTISAAGLVKNKTAILRPEESEFSIWFDGKKYTSKLILNKKKKAFDLKTTGPTDNDNTSRTIKFPSSKMISCFYSQLTECLMLNGFLKEAIKKEAGAIRLYIVWDGYPFFQEAYNDLPNELFSMGQVSYDGKLKADEIRFSLNVGNQNILFVVNEDGHLLRIFWIAQGVTQVRSDLRDAEDGEEE